MRAKMVSFRPDRRTSLALAALEANARLRQTRSSIICEAILEVFKSKRSTLHVSPELDALIKARFPLAKSGGRA